jgi:hypothetical protein
VKEGVCNLARVGIDVKHFVGAQAGERTCRDIAHCVVARFASREAFISQKVQEVRDLLQRHKMILNILPGGEVAFAAAKLLRNSRKLHHLAGRENATGHFGSNHLHARLPLAVNASAKAHCPELVVGQLAIEIL